MPLMEGLAGPRWAITYITASEFHSDALTEGRTEIREVKQLAPGHTAHKASSGTESQVWLQHHGTKPPYVQLLCAGGQSSRPVLNAS